MTRTTRLTFLLAVVVGVSLLHYLTPVRAAGWHAFYRWFYHVPIILAAFWFGLRGGVGFATLVTVLYVPHVLLHWHGGMPAQWLEIVLYNIVGWVTGFLSERQRSERDRYRHAAEELDLAYAELKERARILVETEEQLRIADRLSALGQLSAGLAHEIRTPLASIRGASEILAASSEEKERNEFGEILLSEVDRLNGVVNRFLDFARPREKASSSADVAEASREVVRLVRPEAERRGIRIIEDLGEELPDVSLDPEQLRQVLLNLVMNSLQAMERGGSLRVAASREDGEIRLDVEDSGPGIPLDQRTKVFDPFFTTRERGTGLGLSIVKKILMNHGASIEIGDREGGGARIRLRFPGAGPGAD